jgi:uncharacterized protein YeaO (DUF488 family)
VDLIVKRVYDAPEKSDGYRVLVDRLWPRGLSKDRAALDEWIKELGPSTELRHWFGHDPARWDEFRSRYAGELTGSEDLWRPLLERARSQRVCLLFGASDTEHNQAVALQEFLARQR